MRIAKGDIDGAVAKFEAAHQKTPQFALLAIRRIARRRSRTKASRVIGMLVAKLFPYTGRLLLFTNSRVFANYSGRAQGRTSP
jgi:hypothetical protein